MVLPVLAARVGAGATKIASTAAKTVSSGTQKAVQKTASVPNMKSQFQRQQNQVRNIPTNTPVNIPQTTNTSKEEIEQQTEEQEEQETFEQESIRSLIQSKMAQAKLQESTQQEIQQEESGMADKNSDAKNMAKQMIPRGASFVANGIASVLNIGTAGVSLIFTIFIYVFSLGYLNAQMFFGKKNSLIGELSWAPIPMPIDKNANILKGLILMADLLLIIAIIVFFALNALILLVWLSPLLVPVYFLDYIKGLFFS